MFYQVSVKMSKWKECSLGNCGDVHHMNKLSSIRVIELGIFCGWGTYF